MLRYVLLSALTVGGFVSACGSKIDDLESKKQTSNVAYTEDAGVVTATISATAQTNQTLVASPKSKVADAAITFPPGALSIDTAIALGSANDQSTAILAELGITTPAGKGEPIYIAPATGTPPQAAVPLSIQIPLPLGDAPASTTLALNATESKVVLLYVVYNNGWKAGIIPLTSASFVGAFLKQAISGLGYFQIIYLAAPTTENEVTSIITPSLSEDSLAESETETHGSKAVTCTGDASGNLASHSYIKGCRLYKVNSSKRNSECPYLVGDIINVGVDGNGAISLLNASDERSAGTIAAAPTAAADKVTAVFNVPDATDANRSVVNLFFNENSPYAPVQADAMTLEIYANGQVSKTCVFDYDSDIK